MQLLYEPLLDPAEDAGPYQELAQESWCQQEKEKEISFRKNHSISLKMQQILERHMRSNHDNLEEKSDALL